MPCISLKFYFYTGFPVHQAPTNLMIYRTDAEETRKKSQKKSSFKKIKLFTKNFIFFWCMAVLYFNRANLKAKKKNSSKVLVSFFIVKVERTRFTLLRAPFRDKLAKKKLWIKRYKLVFSMDFKQTPAIVKTAQLGHFFSLFKLFFCPIETNLLSQHKHSTVFSTNVDKIFLSKI